MSDIFISYSRADKDYARGFADLLKSDGHEVWWDADIHAGEIFSDRIKKQLDRSWRVICLWSMNSRESPWVWAEATIAAGERKLVPVLLDSCALPKHLAKFQHIEFAGYARFLQEFHKFAPSGFDHQSYVYQAQPVPEPLPAPGTSMLWKIICALLLAGSIAFYVAWNSTSQQVSAMSQQISDITRRLDTLKRGMTVLSAKLRSSDQQLSQQDIARELEELLNSVK